MNVFAFAFLTILLATKAQPKRHRLQRDLYYIQPHLCYWIRESPPRKDMSRFCRMAACMKRRRIVH